MPLREKAKNLFKTKSRGSSTSTDKDGYPDNVYKPGEEMPRPKYRAIPKKEHKEKLEAFSFGDAWRKSSFQSTYSPMGTRAPSRRASLFSNLRRKSLGGKSAGRSASVTSEDTEKSGARYREGSGAAMIPTLRVEREQEGDDDVGNVGLSRVQSQDNKADARPRTAEDTQTNGTTNGLHKTTTAYDHHPFSEQDLTHAMTRSQTQIAAQS